MGGVIPDEETRGSKIRNRNGSTVPPRSRCNVVRLFTIPLFVVTIIMFTAIASVFLATSCEKGSKTVLHGNGLESKLGDSNSDSSDVKNIAIINNPGLPGDGGGSESSGGEGFLDIGGEIAGPLGEPQSLTDDSVDSIDPWGPVTMQLQVEIAPNQFVTVNRLASPDPFTGTYQLPNGDIVTTNEPIENILSSYSVDLPASTTYWEEPNGNTYEIAVGQMLVQFKPEITQQQILQFIADHELYVVFSWFEPPEVIGAGNSIAWFQFEYDEDEFPTMDDAYDFFSTNNMVLHAQPNTLDEYHPDYSPPNDPIYTGWLEINYPYNPHLPQAKFVNLFGVDSISQIPYGPEGGTAFSSQIVAVIDCGVYRNHPDLSGYACVGSTMQFYSHVSPIGVRCTDKEVFVGYREGEPTDWDTERQGLVSHGTRVAGVISSATNNYIGTASLAPNAKILPIRLAGKFDSEGDYYYTASSIVKAIRALRFQFYHTAWQGKVRVVNMSFSGGNEMTNAWSPLSLQTNITRDLNQNDRLYVGSAGNDASNVLYYPAAFSNVLGVTGLWTEVTGSYWYGSIDEDGSNYYNDNYTTYPVSGIFDFVDIGAGVMHMSTCPPGYCDSFTEIDGDLVSGYGIYGEYEHLNGTSACAPQISSLAFHLYRIHPNSTYTSIWNRIVSTRDTTTQQYPIAGVADFDAAINGW